MRESRKKKTERVGSEGKPYDKRRHDPIPLGRLSVFFNKLADKIMGAILNIKKRNRGDPLITVGVIPCL